MLEIDGSRGEGGGQILRTSLALAAMLGRPVRFTQIRAHRAKPGLQRQHLACVEAAAAVCGGEVRGASIGATECELVPGTLRGGDWVFEIGSAGSCGLVFQTILLPLLAAPTASKVVIEGGTHNSMAPPFEFLARAFLPLIARMGGRVTLTLDRHGFYPAGGGRIVAEIEPSTLTPLELVDGGAIVRTSARSVISKLPRHVGERELGIVHRELEWPGGDVVEVESHGPGNALVLEIERAHVTEVITGFGEKGLPAERVADRATREAAVYLEAGVPVGEHLADQLMLPAAVAGHAKYRTMPLSQHSRTNLDTIRLFMDLDVVETPTPGGVTIELTARR